MDNSPENNPKYPINESDPAKIAHHYRTNILNIKDWNEQVAKVGRKILELELEVSRLKAFYFQVGIEHEHKSNQ